MATYLQGHISGDVLVPGDLTAAEQKEIPLFKATQAVDNMTVYVVCYEDVTENDTDYITLEINSATGASATLTPMMTAVTTKATGGIDINDGVAVGFTLTTDNLAAGSYMVLEITKTGAGKALPPMLVHYECDIVGN